VREKRLSNVELRLSRLEDDEPSREERGILELFGEDDDDEAPDEDAPLARDQSE
jgi:hypothetical protein